MMLVQVCFLVWAVLLLREHFAFVYAGLLFILPIEMKIHPIKWRG